VRIKNQCNTILITDLGSLWLHIDANDVQMLRPSRLSFYATGEHTAISNVYIARVAVRRDIRRFKGIT
jgi:hypothetical protein